MINTTFVDGLFYYPVQGGLIYVLPNDRIQYYIDDAITPIEIDPQTGTWEAYYGVPSPYAPAGAGSPVPRKQAVNALMFRIYPTDNAAVSFWKGGGGGWERGGPARR